MTERQEGWVDPGVLDAIRAEMHAYESMREDLETDHLGDWVVIYGCELAGTYPDFQKAAADAVRRFGNGPYHIRQIGPDPVEQMAPALAFGLA